MRLLTALFLLTGPGACVLAGADVSVTEDKGIYVLENSAMRVEVDPSAGARIRSWIVKPEGRDLVALWKGAGEIGGLLDDRAYFTSMRYRVAIMNPGPETGILRLEADHPSGLSVLKIISLAKDAPALTANYEWSNGTQVPQRLFVRNFVLPGTRPQTDRHLYWVNGRGERTDAQTLGAPDAGEYYIPGSPAYAALWDGETGDGLVTIAPGIARFYFWRGSREFPTFEWLYEPTAPGKVLRATVRLVSVCGQTEAPDWGALAQAKSEGLLGGSLGDVPGWVDEATRFSVTNADRERGLWLSVGDDTGKQRLGETLELDLPRNATRHVAVTVNALRDLTGRVQVSVPREWAEAIAPLWEVASNLRKEVLPLGEAPVSVGAGTPANLWLRVNSAGVPPGEHAIPLGLSIGDASALFSLKLTVWPVEEPTQRPFHVRGYSNGFPVWAGGYEVTEQSLRRLEKTVEAFADMGGDVIEWEVVWHEIVARTKLAATGESLPQVARAEPERIDLDTLPALDFSYFDPWFEMARRHGLRRIDTYMEDMSSSRWPWILLNPAVGANRVKPGSDEARKVIVWFYREMRRYFEAQGLEGFFCKISDEISPEHIPSHIATAQVAREAGWRPFTTITGMIARTAGHINEMNPHCDQWQLAFSLKDDFLNLRDTRASLVTEEHALSGTWGHYTNGGAVDTYGMRVFGEGAPIGVSPADVESFELLEDGEPLRTLGDSPWGNKERGVVITAGSLGAYLYISPRTGVPADHTYTLKLTVRKVGADGEPLIRLDDTDEVWCYGGGSSPFRAAYSNGYQYPVMTLYHGLGGFGQWAFLHWNPTEKIIWVDPETAQVTVSPVYCGYRDGWHDCLLLAEVIRRQGRGSLAGLVGAGDDAILRVEPVSREVYRFTTLSNVNDPVAVNRARREALRVLAGG